MDYVISYDITDDRRRQRMANALLDYGRRIQESVFWAELDDRLRARLCKRILGILNEMEDNVVLIPVCAGCRKGVVELGRAEFPEVKDFYVL